MNRVCFNAASVLIGLISHLLLCVILANFRNKATMPVLQEMLPPDMLEYCQEHGLLDAVTSNVARLPSDPNFE